MKKGRAAPDWWDECPPLVEGDEFYLAAFWQLDTCRSLAQGSLCPIPWTAMVQYAQFHQLEDDVSEAFVQIITAMDATWLEWMREEQAAKDAADAAGRKG